MKASEIVRVTNGKLISGRSDFDIAPHRFSTDSRAIKQGCFFVALRGPNFDGNDFVAAAFRRGASGAIVSSLSTIRYPLYADKVIIKVNDTAKAYGAIARHHRRLFDIPVIAVTGSNGKTTTKDMIAHLLSGKFSVLKNDGTKNNHIGVPETLLKLKKSVDLAVLEIGMNHLGEIGYLSLLARPSIGVITNIGPSHLEHLRSLDNVFRAKKELLKRLPSNGLAVLNGDDEFLSRVVTRRLKLITFGLGPRNDISASRVRFDKGVWNFLVNGRYPFRLNLLGRHNIYNALSAIAVSAHFGLGFSYMAGRLSRFKESSGIRLVVKKISGIRFIDDSYNSNPLSLRCALETLLECETTGKRFLVTGDMFELGRMARSFHADIGAVVARSKIDYLFTIGRLSEGTRREAVRRGMQETHARRCSGPLEAANLLRRLAGPDDVVLVKGSRVMRMEKVIDEFKKIC